MLRKKPSANQCRKAQLFPTTKTFPIDTLEASLQNATRNLKLGGPGRSTGPGVCARGPPATDRCYSCDSELSARAVCGIVADVNEWRVFWISELAHSSAASLSPKMQTVERGRRQSCGRHSVEPVRWRLVRSLQLCFYCTNDSRKVKRGTECDCT